MGGDTYNQALDEDEKVMKKDVTSDYKLGRVLGKGAFAKVHIGTRLKGGAEKRAVKVVELKALNSSDIDALDLEIKTMRRVKHHNIVGLYECYLHADKFIMVLELCAAACHQDDASARVEEQLSPGPALSGRGHDFTAQVQGRRAVRSDRGQGALR